jgi:hypothetical protein
MLSHKALHQGDSVAITYSKNVLPLMRSQEGYSYEPT